MIFLDFIRRLLVNKDEDESHGYLTICATPAKSKRIAMLEVPDNNEQEKDILLLTTNASVQCSILESLL